MPDKIPKVENAVKPDLGKSIIDSGYLRMKNGEVLDCKSLQFDALSLFFVCETDQGIYAVNRNEVVMIAKPKA